MHLLILLVLISTAVAQPVGQVSPTNLDFGSVLVGTTSRQFEVILKNTGDATMTVPSISTNGPFAVAVNKCQRAIKPGANCKVWVTYTPQVVEKDAGALTFTDNASNSPQTVSLMGTGATFESFYQFPRNGTKGASPQGGMVFDTKGNLYGTTEGGGAYGFGTVYKLTTNGTETVLHNFAGQPNDGEYPNGGLVFDVQGNLYGTTWQGGSSMNCPRGCGTVFKLSTDGTETILHAFAGPNDGSNPFGSVVLDDYGNLYGTTLYGGSGGDIYGYGAVYKLTPSGTETVLYSFTGSPNDGESPWAGLVLDAQGNLYGTTNSGGTSTNCAGGCGTVFKLTPSGIENILYSFIGYPSDGSSPSTALVFDAEGNLYGVTPNGGSSGICGKGCGTVFKLSPSGTETVLYSFAGYPSDGWDPYGALVVDQQGYLYGTTTLGGDSPNCPYGCGTAFELSPDGTETLLYTFIGKSDGWSPSGVIFGPQGNLYGTTFQGGAFQKGRLQICFRGCGVVFAVATK